MDYNSGGGAPGVLCKIDAKYKQYIVYEHGKPVIYAKLNKALYGTVQAAYLFWIDMTEQLEGLKSIRMTGVWQIRWLGSTN